MSETLGPSPEEMGIKTKEEPKKETLKNPEINETRNLIKEAQEEEANDPNIPSLEESANEAIRNKDPKSALKEFFKNPLGSISNFFKKLTPENKKRLLVAGISGLVASASFVVTSPLTLILGSYLCYKSSERLILDILSKGKYKPPPSDYEILSDLKSKNNK